MGTKLVCVCVCLRVLTCDGSRALGKMALTGLSRGDKQVFSLECLCFSAIWGEPGNVDRVEILEQQGDETTTHKQC